MHSNDSHERHPLEDFKYCPKCGSGRFEVNNVKSKRCHDCGFVYYFNPSAAVACFIRNDRGEILVSRRGVEPAKGMFDLPGGFVDSYETAEQAVRREILEETGLEIGAPRYLFSLPNIYRYSDFDVHTLDMCFECRVPTFAGAQAADDVAELTAVAVEELDQADFGLSSIQTAVVMYKRMVAEERE